MGRILRFVLLWGLLAPAIALGPVAAPAVAQTAAPAAPAADRDAGLAWLDGYIRDAMRDWEVPGLAIAVVRNDSVIFAEGYGERTVGSGQPVDENTLFAIASTTKAMTVAAMGMLVDQGELDWDDRVAEHLPAIEFHDPYVRHHITIRDLLTHRTGVSRSDNVWIATPIDRAEVMRRVRYLPQANGFREEYGYNNIMYMMAGEIVAAASGMEWNDFIETRLFDPLGMDRSTTRTDVMRSRDGVASGHTRHEGRIIAMPRRDYDALGPAGSVWSSAEDMARWLRLHLAEGRVEGRRLLEPETLDAMYQPQVFIETDTATQRLIPSRNFRAYGMGWRLEDYHGRTVVQHTGGVNYTSTQVGFVPSAGIGVVVLANYSGSQLHTALMYQVFDALLGVPATDWSAALREISERSAAASARRAAELEASRIPGTRPSLALDAYTGTFSDDLYGEIEVTLEDGGLVLRYAPDYVADLEHWHHDTFRAVWRITGFGDPFVTFTLDARARAAALDLQGFTTFRR